MGKKQGATRITMRIPAPIFLLGFLAAVSVYSEDTALPSEEEGREKLLSCLNSGGNCAPFSTDLMRYLQVSESAEEFEDDSGLVEVPERRSSYLFRSRRSPFDPKRSSTYLWRTRKAYLDPRGTRGKEYLFRTRKMDPRLATRGNYLFRTRKADALMDRMLRSSKSYLFRTR